MPFTVHHFPAGNDDNHPRDRDRDDRRRTQLDCARVVLERSSSLLLSSSDAFLVARRRRRHRGLTAASASAAAAAAAAAAEGADCSVAESGARENRDTVFCQMRRALDLVHFVAKEGVMVRK